LPDSICNLEKEIYQLLNDVVQLTNKLYQEENSNLNKIAKNPEGADAAEVIESIVQNSEPVISISQAARLLSPTFHFFRLQVATEFSFALCDMIAGSNRLKQLLLETDSLESRLNQIKRTLTDARTFLIDEVDVYEEPFN
jgi:predicted  nucleic acid-binding Zn-ribbon protein